MQYDPYGEVLTSTLPPDLTDRLFTGQRLDSSTGLYYYNARYYDPHLGRFIQPDTLVPDPLNPQAWNRYAYVYGNPVNHTDPTGHFMESPFDLADLLVDAVDCLGGDELSCVASAYDVVALAIPGLVASYGSQYYGDMYRGALHYDDAEEAARRAEVILGPERPGQFVTWESPASDFHQRLRATSSRQEFLDDFTREEGLTFDRGLLGRPMYDNSIPGSGKTRVGHDGERFGSRVSVSEKAFRSEAKLRGTLAHEDVHVAQIRQELRLHRAPTDTEYWLHEMAAYRYEIENASWLGYSRAELDEAIWYWKVARARYRASVLPPPPRRYR